MQPWFDENDLGAKLDETSPFDLPGCVATPMENEATGKDELTFFPHPTWQRVYCKFGYMPRKDKIGRLWFWLPEGEDKVVLLTVGFATKREVTLLKQINHVFGQL